MNEKIELKINYMADDYAHGFRHIQQRNFLVRYSYLLPFVIIFATLLFLFIKNPKETVYVFSKPEAFLPFLIALVTVIPIFYLFKRRKSSFLVRKQFERQIKSSPTLQETKTIIFDE